MSKLKAKILFLDIELAPIEAHVWQLFDQNVGLNQIQQDWTVFSWAAKWAHGKNVMYSDVSKQKNKRDDRAMLKGIWKLLDEADIVIGQNSKRFDVKKLNARFVIHGMRPPSCYRQLDTREMAKKNFSFTSNKLEYLSEKLCTKYRKLKHKKFPGHELWVECLNGNKEAWREMEKYNKHDVLATEELYNALKAWDNSINFAHYEDHEVPMCSCGSPRLNKYGFRFTNGGKYQRYVCDDCGKSHVDKHNLLSKNRRKAALK